jgi:hypothetical protein
MSDVKFRIIHITCLGTSYAIAVTQNVGILWNVCVSFVFNCSHCQVKKVTFCYKYFFHYTKPIVWLCGCF